MATVINNPGTTVERERVIETDSGAGWAIAVIVLLAVIAVGAYFWTHRAPAQTPTDNPSANINVTLPSAGTQPSGDTTGGGNAQTAPAY